MSTPTSLYRSIRTNIPKLIVIGLLSILTACASVETKTTGLEDQLVQQHELFDGNIDNTTIQQERLKGTRSGTSFDDIELEDLTEDQLSLLKKRKSMQQGDLAIQTGDTNLALYHYVKALIEDTKDIQIYYKIGGLHESRNNNRLASLSYQKALSINPGFVLALESIGRIKLNNREYVDARVYFTKAISHDQQRVSNKDKTKNRPGLISEHDIDYYSPFYAYTGIGVIEDLNKNHAAAISFYQKALQIRPTSAAAESNIGYSFYLINDIEKAESHFKRAISKDKRYGKAWSNLALVYVKKGLFTQAVNILIDYNGDKPSAYNTVGYLCMLEEKYNQAEQFFNQAIDSSPIYFKIAVENRELNRRQYSGTVYESLN